MIRYALIQSGWTPDILAAQADLEASDVEMDQLFLLGKGLA